jgi:hypothetical protein
MVQSFIELKQPIDPHLRRRMLFVPGTCMRRLTKRWSQPLGVVMTRFRFLRELSTLRKLGVA